MSWGRLYSLSHRLRPSPCHTHCLDSIPTHRSFACDTILLLQIHTDRLDLCLLNSDPSDRTTLFSKLSSYIGVRLLPNFIFNLRHRFVPAEGLYEQYTRDITFYWPGVFCDGICSLDGIKDKGFPYDIRQRTLSHLHHGFMHMQTR